MLVAFLKGTKLTLIKTQMSARDNKMFENFSQMKKKCSFFYQVSFSLHKKDRY